MCLRHLLLGVDDINSSNESLVNNELAAITVWRHHIIETTHTVAVPACVVTLMALSSHVIGPTLANRGPCVIHSLPIKPLYKLGN